MPSSDSSSPVSIMLPNLAILLLVAMGLFSNRDALDSARPVGSSPAREYRAARIRSWEDPLSVPRPSSGRETVLNELDVADDMERQLDQFHEGYRKTHPSIGGDRRLLVLPVLLPNDAREDEAEIRLRIRYAVNAALARLQYINVRPDRMSVGNLVVAGRGPRKAALTVRTELFEPRNIIADNVLMPEPPVFWGEPLSDTDRVERSGSELLKIPRPYPLVCVLWLDESQLHWRSSSLAAIEEVVSKLIPTAWSRDIRVIGPNDSDLLAKWLELSPNQPPDIPKDANRILLSPRATASDAVLRMSLSTAADATQQHLALAQSGWRLERTIATDDVLVKALIAELRLRNALPRKDPDGLAGASSAAHSQRGDTAGESNRRGFNPLESLRALKPGRPHIAIIAEWNTLYARSMARTFSAVLQNETRSVHALPEDRRSWSTTPLAATPGGGFVHEYTYLRGLDGLAESDNRGRNTASRREDSNESSDTPGGTMSLRSAQGLNAASGTSQLDYLRRLEAELQRLDRRLRLNGERFSAIGILGSDTYDKLLILRALKKSFPHAIFFTTDIDAGYLDRHEAEFTRNLVIASAHGLTTSPALQYSTPPFRDSYQTALYLTTLRALGLEEVGTKDFQPTHGAAVLAEVGITRINLLAQYSQGQLHRLPNEGGSGVDRTFAEVHPNTTAPWWGSSLRRMLLALCILLLLAAATLCCYSRSLLASMWLLTSAGTFALLVAVKPHIDFLGETTLSAVFYTVAPGCFLAAFAVFYWLTSTASDVSAFAPTRLRIGMGLAFVFACLGIGAWLVIARYVNNAAEEEPVLLSEGISIWPTIFLRAAALVWCVWSAFHIERVLAEVKVPLVRRAAGLTVPPFRSGHLVAWNHYSPHMAHGARAGWSVLGIVTLALIATVLGLATGMPVVPARGPISHAAATGILLTTVFVYLNLLFQVVYSMVQCRRFIDDLNAGLNSASGRLEAEAIDSIDLLASRIGRLVYLPFTAIFMLIAARNPVFDAWDWPVVLVAVFSFGLIVLIWSYLALLSSARNARSRALDFLHRKLLALAEGERRSLAASNLPPTVDSTAEVTGDRPAAGGQVLTSPAVAAAEPDIREREEPAEYWQMLLERIRALDGAIYRPWYQSPLLGAILIPLGGSGSIKLLEQLLRAG